MKHQLANRFCTLLLDAIGADGIEYCQALNKLHIDVVGSEMDCESDGDITLWNAAWTIARANNYKPA